MTQKEILKLMDEANKEILDLSKQITKDTKNLPDINCVGRIGNNIQRIKHLYFKIQILTEIVV